MLVKYERDLKLPLLNFYSKNCKNIDLNSGFPFYNKIGEEINLNCL